MHIILNASRSLVQGSRFFLSRLWLRYWSQFKKLLIPDPMDRIIGDPDNFRGSIGSGISASAIGITALIKGPPLKIAAPCGPPYKLWALTYMGLSYIYLYESEETC